MLSRSIYLIVLSVLLAATTLSGQPALTLEDLLAEAETALAQAYEGGLNLLAPTRVSKAETSVKEARKQMESGGSEQLVRLSLESAIESLETAAASTAQTRERLQIVLDARAAALLAGAEQTNLPIWQKAERGLRDLAASIEVGRDAEVNGLREPLAQQYWAARRESLRDGLLANAKADVAAAQKAGCDQQFPMLMARARQAVSRAEAFLTQESLDECRIAAAEASRHAKHAIGQLNYLNDTKKSRTQIETMLLPYDDLLFEIALASGDTLDFSRGGAEAVKDFRKLYSRIQAKLKAERDSLERATGRSHESMERSLTEMQTRFADVQNQMIELEQRMRDMQMERDVAVSRLRKNELTAQRVQLAQTAFDPGDAVVYQTMEGNVIIHLYGVKFASGKSTVDRDQRAILKKAAEAISVFPGVGVTVEGHTDDDGSEEGNLELSQKRAEAVGKLLQEEVPQSVSIQTIGKGESSPIASNKTARGKALNRRIDLVLSLPSPK